MIKKKIISFIPFIFLILFQIFVYLIEPYIVSPNRLFIISSIFLCIVYLIYSKIFNDDSKIIYLIIGIGILLRTLYILKTDIYTRQHDVETLSSNGHLKYIYDIFKTGNLPSTNDWQLYHPPLFHLIGALWLKINNVLGISLEKSLEGLQVITCIFSSLIMFTVYKITNKLDIKFISKLLINSFMAFYPTFIILSGSVNNDCLLVLLEFTIILYLIKWYEESSVKNTILLAIFTGLCVMTKLNGAIMAVPIMYAFIRKIIDIIKEDKCKLKGIIIKIISFGSISLPIGLWYQVREYILFGNNNVPNPVDWLYTGNHSFISRFLSIDFNSLFHIFCIIPGDYNLFSYIVKCSIFGEYTYEGNELLSLSLLLLNFILIIISLICIVKYILKRREHSFIKNLLLINWIINIVSFILFNIKYPYLCTMDYRYIVPTVFTGIVLVVCNYDNKKNTFSYITKCMIVLFSLLSILFIINI